MEIIRSVSSTMKPQERATVGGIIRRALEEDLGAGDITTAAIVASDEVAQGHVIAKSEGVIAGLELAEMLFSIVDREIRFTAPMRDGDPVRKGETVAEMKGPARSLLSSERILLNFLQRMSGIATMTRAFVNSVEGTGAAILDTRKTAPGLRVLDKWAVRIGGGENHRLGLYDVVMIKENHIAIAGSLTEAVRRIRGQKSACPDEVGEVSPSTRPAKAAGLAQGERSEIGLSTRPAKAAGLAQGERSDVRGPGGPRRKIIVEVRTLDELREGLSVGVDQILLDNMPLEVMREAVGITNGEILLEASGNVTLENVREIAETGVDFISVGALTHSVKAMDLSFVVHAP